MPRGQPYTRQQWCTLCVIGSVHFASAICISLQAPFYPQEAESKGGTATEYGLVFGVFELTAFLSSPLFGKYLHVIGAKIQLNVGIFLAAICCILFGLLDMLRSHAWFIAMSFVVRIVESLGASAALTAAFAITASAFPESVATTFATLEVFYGVGYIVGPTIGGFLFVAGGYMLPFIVMGSCLLLVGVFIFCALPATVGESHSNNDKGERQLGVIAVLAVPAVLVDSLCIMAASSSMGFYSATLEPHLRQFKLTAIAICGMFVLSGAMYALFAPFVGRLCDRQVSPRLLTLAGCWLVLVGCLMIGPAPFTEIKPSLGLCIAGLLIHGLGLALILVSCFIDAIRSAVASGFSDGLATYGLVSGLWASSFSLGAFIGPSIAGVLYDMVGFRSSTYFVLGTLLFVFIVVLCFVCAGDNEIEHQLIRSQRLKRLDDEVGGFGEADELMMAPSSTKSSSSPLYTSTWELPSDCRYGAVSSSRNMGSLEVYG